MAEIYHVLSRGVEKRQIFLDEPDYLRFIHDLFEFNDEKAATNNFYKYNDVGHRYIEREPRKLLAKIHAFCLMPNHYHLLLEPVIEKGIALFMKKINGGYAKYFNIKYQRRGTLFETRYKKILVNAEPYFIHLPYYIHLNPLDIAAPEWRERKIKNYNEAIKFLESYRWSSHIDYLGEKNFPSVTQRDFLLEYFGGHAQYKQSIQRYLKTFDLENIKNLCLE
jgi:putative transposase